MKLIDDEEIKSLENVKKRLFDGRRLTFDERCDLAKTLDCVLRNLFDNQSKPIRVLCNDELTKIVKPAFVSKLHRDADDPKRFEEVKAGKFTVSIQASDFHRCEPRITSDDPKKYSEFELAFFDVNHKWLCLEELPEEVQAILKGYNDGTKECEVFDYVPIDKIQAVIDLLEKVE